MANTIISFLTAARMKYLPAVQPPVTDIAPVAVPLTLTDPDPMDSPDAFRGQYTLFVRASQPLGVLALASPDNAPGMGPSLLGPNHPIADYITPPQKIQPVYTPLPSKAKEDQPLPATAVRFLVKPIPPQILPAIYGKS